MKENRILHALGEVDDAYIAEASPAQPKKRRWIKFAATAACLALVAAGGAFALRRPAAVDPARAPITLSDRSSGVKIKYISADNLPKTSSAYCLVWLELDEIFARDTTIFRGTVSYIDNIALDFNGRKSYRAIAGIVVDEVIQGDVRAGEVVPILLPCGIHDDIWVEDTDIVAQMRVGMEGIFMPKAYDDDSRWEENGATLYLNEVAPYGLWDGMRWVFLDTGSGLVFEKGLYADIASAGTLDQVEAYIREQLG